MINNEIGCKKTLLAAVLLMIPTNGFAQVWSCKEAGRLNATYTNTPAPSASVACEPLTEARGRLNKLPMDGFLKAAKTDAALAAGSDVEPQKESKSIGRNGARANLAQPSQKFSTTWQSEEVASEKSSGQPRVYFNEPHCKITGVARGALPGDGMVTVTRGAVTVDTVRVMIKSKNGTAAWKMLVKGKCRNPEVIVRTGHS